LRMGKLPLAADGSEAKVTLKSSVKQLLAGASLLQAFKESPSENPELSMQHKELITFLSSMEPVHQEIIWGVYYKGQSMRSMAAEWGIDDLSVIREHKVLLAFLCQNLETPGNGKTVKVRRGLRTVVQELRRAKKLGPFSDFLATSALILIALCVSIFSKGAI